MNEHFLTYEQSLAVKELGFNEPTFFAFDNCNMRCSDLRTNEQKFNGVNYNSSTYTSQPLKSQFFKWARDKHGVNSHIEDIGANNTYEFWINGKDFIPVAVFYKNNYSTYEQAEDACINKIIGILKLK